MSLRYGYTPQKVALFDNLRHVKMGEILVTHRLPNNHYLHFPGRQESQGISCSFQIKSNQIKSHHRKVFSFPRLITAFLKDTLAIPETLLITKK